MKVVHSFAVFLVLIQASICQSGCSSGEVDLKLKILTEVGSMKPRYEVTFYKKGQEIARRVFEDGKAIYSKGEIPEGIVFERYVDGTVKNIITYKGEKRNGEALSFYKNGKIKSMGEYRDDNPIGVGKLFYENGNILAEWEIRNGKEIYHREYYENGRLKEDISRGR